VIDRFDFFMAQRIITCPLNHAEGTSRRLRRAGKDVHLTEYAEAHHAFDNHLYSPALSLSDAVTTNHCSRQEHLGGDIVNLETGQPFRWSDACVRHGATVA